jgi:hypothetical protein
MAIIWNTFVVYQNRRKHLWKALCKDCSFSPDPLANMVGTGNSCCWLDQQHELPVLAMFVNGSQMSNLYRGPSIDATYHVSVHYSHRQLLFLVGQFLKISETAWPNELKLGRKHIWKVLYKDCSSMFVNGSQMSNLYRGPSIDATYHVSVHLAKQFQSRRCFRNRPISNKNCLWRPWNRLAKWTETW